MRLPYDMALERGWDHGVRIALCRPNLVDLTPEHGQSDIVDPYSATQSYRANRLPFYRRVPTALFRGADYVRRVGYALAPSLCLAWPSADIPAPLRPLPGSRSEEDAG